MGRGANRIAVQFRVDPELLEEFREIARSQRRSGSGEIEIAIQRHVEAMRGEATAGRSSRRKNRMAEAATA